MKKILATLFSMLVVLCVAVSVSASAPIHVDCGRGGSIGGTLAGLVQSGNTRSITITVTGICRENITIAAFDHLVLQGFPIATLQDGSNGNDPVVTIGSSFDVTLANFTINGGQFGILVQGRSVFTLSRSTVQQAAGDGVIVERSRATSRSSNLLNNGVAGIRGENGSELFVVSNTITNNGAEGIAVSTSCALAVRGGTINGNAAGIGADGSTGVRLSNVTISGNLSDGVRLDSSSSAFFGEPGGNVITANGGNGVSVNDLSFARFDGNNNVSGNLTQPDVACYPQYSATRGAGTVVGTTNCNEPRKDNSAASGKRHGWR